MKRIAIFLAGFAAVHLIAGYLWWLSGVPFERGSNLAFTGLISLLLGGYLGALLADLFGENK